MNKIKLGVNVDHVATIRQARMCHYPNPTQAAQLALAAGADSITIHIREDRRHIQEHDLIELQQLNGVRINLEMALTDEMLALAVKHQPKDICFVPEKREELTTEGGLDVQAFTESLKPAIATLQNHHMRVSLFIEADEAQIHAAKKCGADAIELHTGRYALLEPNSDEWQKERTLIQKMAELGTALGLQVNAGHGLHYDNVQAIAQLKQISEINIGHSIVARALMVGMPQAVKEMIEAMHEPC